MIRQAHAYLAGAASSAALIAAAVVTFVLIAWMSPVRGLPLPDLSGVIDAVSPISSSEDAPAPSSSGTGDAGTGTATGSAFDTPGTPGSSPGAEARSGNGREAAGEGGGTPPGGQQLETRGGLGEGPVASPAPASPVRGDPPAADSGSGSTRRGLQVGDTTVNTQSVTDGVGGAVGAVDHATGGALSQTGVSGAVQGATQGLVGPNSAAGQTVDGTLGTVNDLLGGQDRR